MHLSQLVYISRSTDTERLTVGKILRAAQEFNGPNDITGLLLFDGTYYLQCLEGDRTAISDLYNRITQDPRHKDVALVAAGTRSERDCAGWAMGYIDKRDVVKEAVQRFSASSTFDPYGMSAESTLALVRYVANTPGAVRTTAPR